MSLFSRVRHAIARGSRREARDTVDIPILDSFDGPVYAVGDVHGCLSLYRSVEAQILDDACAFNAPATIVLLGDIVDRGPDSAALIDHLLAPPPGGIRRLCLMGNHEAMMLAYLAAPVANAGWLHLGGYETLASYGLQPNIDTLERMSERRLLQIIAAHLPEIHIKFLQSLLPGLKVGPWLLAHAGADASAPLTAQPRQALLWGHAGLVAPAGLTLVHGHYVTSHPERRARSIGIDTGAYATGHLSALRLVPDHPPAILTKTGETLFRELAIHE